MTAALAKELMIRQNEEFVENKQCQDVYREVLEIHLAEEGQSSNIAVEERSHWLWRRSHSITTWRQ